VSASADEGAVATRRRNRAAVGWFWRAIAFVVTVLRFPILLAWIGAAAAATLYLPGLAAGGGIGDLIPQGAPAVQASYDSARLFGVPLSAEVEVVQRDSRRFTLAEVEDAARQAAAVDEGRVTGISGLAGALPVSNIGRAFPGSRERSTTIITFLYFRPGTSIAAQAGGGEAYARRYLSAPRDHLVGVTGPAPAQDAQGVIIQRYLPWVELGTLAAIALIVGLYFRSVGAPLATLLCAGVAYLVAVRVIAWVGSKTHVTIPPDLEPVLVVLLLGVTTDYVVFYLAGMRSCLEEGLGRIQAARRTAAETTPIIVTAGLVVAAGIASLMAARLAALRAFGPGLALSVLIAMAVAITLAPALIAIFGTLLFRPGTARLRRAVAASKRGTAPPGVTRRGGERTLTVPQAWQTWQAWTTRLANTRPVALLVAAACVVGLLAGGLGVRQIRLSFPLIRALPATAEAARAQAAASQGFVPGILSPTEVLALGPGVTRQRAALARLQRALAARSGVAGVVGPANVAAAPQAAQLVLAKSGDAARFGVIEQTDPLGATAIDQVRDLRRDLPTMARMAGLARVRFEVGGETALAGEAIDSVLADVGRIALVIGLVIVVLLIFFLGAVVAPFYLLAASVLALLSTLGLTAWIFQVLLGYGSLVYYVPFIVAVLLVSLGSDYNVFVVGRIWEEARRRPLREAVAVAAPRASRAITTAGLALAAGFGVLAIVPLDQFREMAVAMALGIVIDTFVVRSMLVPALVMLFGRLGSWPARLQTRPSGQSPRSSVGADRRQHHAARAG
jgi:putative drug exporter of the RND superfamily